MSVTLDSASNASWYQIAARRALTCTSSSKTYIFLLFACVLASAILGGIFWWQGDFEHTVLKQKNHNFVVAPGYAAVTFYTAPCFSENSVESICPRCILCELIIFSTISCLLIAIARECCLRIHPGAAAHFCAKKCKKHFSACFYEPIAPTLGVVLQMAQQLFEAKCLHSLFFMKTLPVLVVLLGIKKFNFDAAS